MLHYRLSFLQCDWRRDISLQKVTTLMKPEVSAGCHQTLSRRWGLGTRLSILIRKTVMAWTDHASHTLRRVWSRCNYELSPGNANYINGALTVEVLRVQLASRCEFQGSFVIYSALRIQSVRHLSVTARGNSC